MTQFAVSLSAEEARHVHRLFGLGGLLVFQDIADLAPRLAAEHERLTGNPDAYVLLHERVVTILLGQLWDMTKEPHASPVDRSGT